MTYITPDYIRKSTNTIFVFGDNLQQVGLGGQAKVARPFVAEGKTIGIPTKRAPCERSDCYFSDRDDEIAAVRHSFSRIRREITNGKKVVFFPNIGGGYADLRSRSPIIFGMVQGFIKANGGE